MKSIVQRVREKLSRPKITKAEKIARGHEAEKLINNPILNDAFERIEIKIYEKWRTSKGNDEEARKNAYLMQRLLDDLRGELVLDVRRAAFEKSAQKREAGGDNVEQIFDRGTS